MKFQANIILFFISIPFFAQGTTRILLLNGSVINHPISVDNKRNYNLSDTGFAFFYQQACSFALSNDKEKSFVYLKEAIMRGAAGEDVITDTDFDILRLDVQGWSVIDSLLKVQYANRNAGITKLDLGYQLWLMGIEDQRSRTLRKNYKLPGTLITDITKHNENLEQVKKIIKISGWPKYSEVGLEAGNAVFFIFQHDDAKNMKTVLPLLIEAAKAGEADIKNAAMMIDRYLAYTENVQIYGTQAVRKIKPGQNRNDVPLMLYPIVDEENLIQRRNALGMVDFLENCNRLGVVYISIKDRPEYKKIEIKKTWIDAGYFLVK